MEQFKQTERDSKTKAFSKEGLLQPDEDDEKSEYWNWLSRCIKELNTQTELLEGELEGIPVKKRTGNSRADELNKKIERHRFNVNKLEKILRGLDNESILPEQIDEIKDAVDDYVENNNVIEIN